MRSQCFLPLRHGVEVILRTGGSHVEFWQREAVVSADAYLRRASGREKFFSSKKARAFERQERLVSARQAK